MSYNDLRKGRYSQPGMMYHITTVTHRRFPHFQSLFAGRKVVHALMQLQQEGWATTWCYVLMPDHLHWLMRLDKGSLAKVMQLLKGRSAHAIGYPVWQKNYYDHVVRKEEDLRKLARYIVSNPLRAHLVEQIGDYPLWDAIWLYDGMCRDESRPTHD